jgi:eukaryotic-like serine/threonine-protein kinase
MAAVSADRHLLFGMLALQNGLIDQVALVAAFQAWTRDKAKSLAYHLEARGDLTAAKRALLDALTEVHLETHGGDVEKSLAAVTANRSARARLAGLGEPELEASLARVARGKNGLATEIDDDNDPDRTVGLFPGAADGDGQRFRILRPHARGGLGEVFVALDAELHREVALKQILEKHADDPVSRQRFVAEAEITGGLEHPGVVPVYGLGTYGGGRPYYAMRFIQGDSLKEAIDQFHSDDTLKNNPGRRSLEFLNLLRRFLDVCNAVEYAHSRGVIHRDLKPANVILGKHGETLVVDWGLAKAIGRADPSVGEQTIAPSSSGSSETLPGSAMGTPSYMSPEQAAGDLGRLGPRSDVYSLGASLYCLLTGKPPLEGGDVGEILRKVQAGDFRAPREVDPSLDAALEAVCVKAMATKPEDRYTSCRALAEDLERWAADEPVSVYREPLSRRAQRWAKRNRTIVATALAALLAGVVGLSAVLLVQTQAKADIAQALEREKQARTALATANTKVEVRYELALAAIKTFHTGASEDFLLKQDQFKELRDRLLKAASDFYGKLGALLGSETDAASRRALLQANYEMANLTRQIGRPEDALAAHRAVLARRKELAAAPGADVGAAVDVGRSLTAVARLLDATGQVADALLEFHKSEALLTDLATGDPAARTALANCRSWMGWLLSRMGKTELALAAYRLARSDQEVLAGVAGASQESRRDLATTMNRIAILLSETGKPADAEAEYREALEIQKRLAHENPDVTDFRNDLGLVHNNLGNLLSDVGKPAEAEAEYREALLIQQKLASDQPAVAAFRSALGLTHNNLGNLLRTVGRTADAEAEYRLALEVQEKLTGENPTVTEFRNDLARSYANLGLLQQMTGGPAEAEYRKALAIVQTLADENPTIPSFRDRLARSRHALASLLALRGKSAEAEAEYRKAQAIQQKLAAENPIVTAFREGLAFSHNHLGWLLSETGKPTEGETEYRRAIALLGKLVDDQPAVTDFRQDLAYSHDALGWLMTQTGKPAEAETEYRQALALLGKLVDDHPKVAHYRDRSANTANNLSVALRRLGRLAEARALCERAVVLREDLVRENPRVPDYRAGLAENVFNRGLARLAEGDLAGAASDLRRAIGLYEATPSLRGEQSYLFACTRAALAGLAGRPGSGISAADRATESDAAMTLLHSAVALGYKSLGAYRTADALEPLRRRTDFKLLMMDLAMPAVPFAGTR